MSLALGDAVLEAEPALDGVVGQLEQLAPGEVLVEARFRVVDAAVVAVGHFQLGADADDAGVGVDLAPGRELDAVVGVFGHQFTSTRQGKRMMRAMTVTTTAPRKLGAPSSLRWRGGRGLVRRSPQAMHNLTNRAATPRPKNPNSTCMITSPRSVADPGPRPAGR